MSNTLGPIDSTSSLSDVEFSTLLADTILHKKLHHFAFHLCYNEEQAKDMVQDALCKMWEKRHAFGGGNINARAHTIVRNAFIDDYRSKRIKNNLYNKHIEDITMEQLLHHTNSSSITSDIGEILSIDENIIRQQLYREDLKNKEALRLRMQGYSYQEISSMLGKSMGTIRSQIFHAREQLHRMLQKDFGDSLPRRK